MSNVPADRKYTKSHEWVMDADDGDIVIGITDHAQGQLGDMVYVEVPEVSRVVAAEEACVVVESVKAASDVYAPVSGEVVEVNEAVDGSPELVNQDAYGEGWLIKIRPDHIGELENLMSATEYEEFLASEEG